MAVCFFDAFTHLAASWLSWRGHASTRQAHSPSISIVLVRGMFALRHALCQQMLLLTHPLQCWGRSLMCLVN